MKDHISFFHFSFR